MGCNLITLRAVIIINDLDVIYLISLIDYFIKFSEQYVRYVHHDILSL
jgi:hypothetical protein